MRGGIRVRVRIRVRVAELFCEKQGTHSLSPPFAQMNMLCKHTYIHTCIHTYTHTHSIIYMHTQHIHTYIP